jgi:hypothetical protein
MSARGRGSGTAGPDPTAVATAAAVAVAARYERGPADGLAVIVRPIEDAALGAVDRATLQALQPIDRRYDRRLRDLRLELARAEEADAPEYPGGASRELLDGLGFLFAIVGAGIMFAGRSGGMSMAAAAWSAVLLIAVGVLLHAVGAVVTRHGHASRSAPGYLAFTVLSAFGAASVLAAWPLGPGEPTMAALVIALFVLGGAAVVLLVIASVRALNLARRIRGFDRAIAALRSPFEAEAAELGSAAAAEAADVLDGMDESARSALEAARRAGVDAVAAQGSFAPNAVSRLRSAPPFALRYAEDV